MEFILPLEIIINVFSFLDKKSIMCYDTALCSKSRREIFLLALKNFRICNMCEWTYLRNIKIKEGICPYFNTEYISDNCEKLIVSGDRSKKFVFEVINDNIKTLHVDLGITCAYFESIKCLNLEKITMVNVIHMNIFKNLNINCPKLKKVTMVYCDNANLQDNFNYIHNIEVDVKSNQKIHI
jgi:hypothetical protein